MVKLATPYMADPFIGFDPRRKTVYQQATILSGAGRGTVTFPAVAQGTAWLIERVAVDIPAFTVVASFTLYEMPNALTAAADLVAFGRILDNSTNGQFDISDEDSPALVRPGLYVTGEWTSAAGNAGLTARCNIQIQVIDY